MKRRSMPTSLTAVCIILAATILLSGCEAAGTGAAEPGSLTAHLRGQNVVTFGTGWH